MRGDATRVVVDNGGDTCKLGFAGQEQPLRSVINAMARSKGHNKTFVADTIDACTDFSALQYRRSLERGCLVNWDTQAEVWSRAFGPDVLRINPAECSLLLTEAPMCPTAIQDTLDEMVFEHFGFDSYCTRPAAALAALAIAEQQEKAGAPAHPCSLVVDAGFSATHCVPIFQRAPVNFAIKRLNVGGKLLTNHLKSIVSYRAYNVLDETHLMNDAKERLCYVSLDFERELALTRFKGKKNLIRREFILPDYVNTSRGTIRDPNAPELAAAPAPEPAKPAAKPAAKGGSSVSPRDGPPKKKAALAPEQQVLSLSNERLSVPELLFRPSDIGIEQAGVAECVVQSVGACVADMHEPMYGNIVLTGGSTRFPNFSERLERELRSMVPAEYALNVTAAADPLLAAWRGGSIFAAADDYPMHVVTKAEYREHGHALCRQRFAAV